MIEKHGIKFCCQELEMMWENGDVDYSYAGWLMKIEPFTNILGDKPRGYVMEHCISCGEELKAKSGPKKLSRQTKMIMKELEKRMKKITEERNEIKTKNKHL